MLSWWVTAAATKDTNFTVLGFTATSGEPLLYAVIFAAKMMKNEWITGSDQFAVWIGDEENYEGYCSDGKTYPFGPMGRKSIASAELWEQ